MLDSWSQMARWLQVQLRRLQLPARFKRPQPALLVVQTQLAPQVLHHRVPQLQRHLQLVQLRLLSRPLPSQVSWIGC